MNFAVFISLTHKTSRILILQSLVLGVIRYLDENKDIRRGDHVFKDVNLIPPLDLVSDVELNTLVEQHVICKPQ